MAFDAVARFGEIYFEETGRHVPFIVVPKMATATQTWQVGCGP